MSGRGLIIAAPASGSGKTTVTLGLLRALAKRGHAVAGAKSGPDYIDPQFHEAACGVPCVNLDAWAMSASRIGSLAATSGLRIIEGAMGLFDGAPPDGRGSVADLARILDVPVILVVDAGRMVQSVAPLIAGFAGHDARVRIAGIVLNRVGSERHATTLTRALAPLEIPVLGHLVRDPLLDLPSRHLGLVQALEHRQLADFLDHAADIVARQIDLDALVSLATPLAAAQVSRRLRVPRRIALARDAAFAFTYPHQLAEWTAGGATLLPFSPLADEPVPEADAVVLPGGYPELHAARIAAASTFLESLRRAAATTPVTGECGGYMVLGETLTDANGQVHAMAGLLGLSTSFAARKLHLGYRTLTGPGGHFAAHEFHYATILSERGTPLWQVRDAEGADLPPAGLVDGHVSGSFLHVIAPLDEADRGE